MKTYKNVTSTVLGEKLKLPARKINLILKEAGWLIKKGKGWEATEAGKMVGARIKKYKNNGNPYVIWPADIITKKAFQHILEHYTEEVQNTTQNTNDSKINKIRKPTDNLIRTMDGHYVRSKSEAIIDDWLYMNEIIHSYEKRLPAEQDLFCDFYLPKGNIYIEHWGLDTEQYQAKKKHKKTIYAEYKLNLIETDEKTIKQIDDFLTKELIKYDITLA